jgi:hypothetical protein
MPIVDASPANQSDFMAPSAPSTYERLAAWLLVLLWLAFIGLVLFVL